MKRLLQHRIHNKLYQLQQKSMSLSNNSNSTNSNSNSSSSNSSISEEINNRMNKYKERPKSDLVILYPSVISNLMKTTVLNWNKKNYSIVFDFNKLLNYNGIKVIETEDKYFNEWIKKPETINEIPEIQKIIDYKKTCTKIDHNKMSEDSVIEKVNEVIKDLSERVSDNTIKNIIKKEFSCDYGTKKETNVLDLYNQEYETHLKYTNELFYKELDKYILGGRVDGINIKDIKNPIIVEAKNRINNLFDFVPVYEKMQVHCYMKMLDINETHLIEKYKNTHKIHNIKFREEFYEYLDIYFSNIVSIILKIKSDPSFYNKMSLSEKKTYLINNIRE